MEGISIEIEANRAEPFWSLNGEVGNLKESLPGFYPASDGEAEPETSPRRI